MRKLIIIIYFIFQILNINAQNKKFYYSDSCYISFSEIGQGTTKLIFVHGFGSSMSSWDDIKDKFDPNEFKLYLIDLKGFGSSSVPKDNNYSILEQGKIVSEFINETIDGNYYVIGHSYGGGVSLLLPSLLDVSPNGLILIDCAAYYAKTPFFIDYLKNPILNKFMYCTSAKFRAQYILKRILYKENMSEKLVARYEKSFKGKNKRYSFVKTAKQILPDNYNDIIASYNSIEIPTLIIWGNQDPIVPIEHAVMLSNQIKNSQIKTVDFCGHIPQEEVPEKTYKIINEFIKK
jgi:pimeloyl-ACP methyl ester carboxylesterase